MSKIGINLVYMTCNHSTGRSEAIWHVWAGCGDLKYREYRQMSKNAENRNVRLFSDFFLDIWRYSRYVRSLQPAKTCHIASEGPVLWLHVKYTKLIPILDNSFMENCQKSLKIRLKYGKKIDPK